MYNTNCSYNTVIQQSCPNGFLLPCCDAVGLGLPVLLQLFLNVYFRDGLYWNNSRRVGRLNKAENISL